MRELTFIIYIIVVSFLPLQVYLNQFVRKRRQYLPNVQSSVYGPLFRTIGILFVHICVIYFLYLTFFSWEVNLLLMGVILLVLVCLFFYKAGGDENTKKTVMVGYIMHKDMNPGMPESYILRQTISNRYPDWNEFQIESFLIGCVNIQELVNRIIEFEKTGKMPLTDLFSLK